ncbi:alpha/beta fold hydrolase [Kineosporia succinea]|uniref:Pimeloyl-ACP methyl ester carboxylesterase n=1 Tax=Kineosporia succinea TaxID=84632 RepID=A0ABT9PEP2_9ACTN|nr:alpha/beta hydrolase [Kineosporia succinea]MDP9831178.1 pimeloyl-ACP methyl ester carboxylesterase [Kineosporia succinea]
MTDYLLIHGLTYDHRSFGPLRRHLDPADRVLAIDLPGHGSSPRRESYPLSGTVDDVHQQVTAAHLTRPVVVGHSVGAIVANAYAAVHPAAAVVNLDQMLRPGPFFALVRAAEPQLRGPGWRDVWNRMLAGMGIDALPPQARELVTTATDPRPDLLLGYWDEILRDSDETIDARVGGELAELAARGVGYHWVTSSEPPAAYADWLRSLLPRVAITVIPGSGHFPHLADPAAVARVLESAGSGPRP